MSVQSSFDGMFCFYMNVKLYLSYRYIHTLKYIKIKLVVHFVCWKILICKIHFGHQNEKKLYTYDVVEMDIKMNLIWEIDSCNSITSIKMDINLKDFNENVLKKLYTWCTKNKNNNEWWHFFIGI